MATTSLTLGPHWEAFIQDQVSTGRYSSASEVVRSALRSLEDHERALERLHDHIGEGEADADAGRFAPRPNLEQLMSAAETRVLST